MMLILVKLMTLEVEERPKFVTGGTGINGLSLLGDVTERYCNKKLEQGIQGLE